MTAHFDRRDCWSYSFHSTPLTLLQLLFQLLFQLLRLSMLINCHLVEQIEPMI